MKRLALGALLALAIVNPVSAKPRPFIEVVDSFDEAPGWALYPIDAIYGSPVQARYARSDWAQFTCGSWRQRVYLTGEGGGLSVSVYPDFPHVAGAYTFCHVDLLGKKDRVLASDDFTIFSPV